MSFLFTVVTTPTNAAMGVNLYGTYIEPYDYSRSFIMKKQFDQQLMCSDNSSTAGVKDGCMCSVIHT